MFLRIKLPNKPRGKFSVFLLSRMYLVLKICRTVFFSISFICVFKEFKIYVILSLVSCAPFRFLKPETFKIEQSLSCNEMITSLNVKFNFSSIK